MTTFHDHIFSTACKFTMEMIWFCIFSTVSFLILPILLLVVSKSVILCGCILGSNISFIETPYNLEIFSKIFKYFDIILIFTEITLLIAIIGHM